LPRHSGKWGLDIDELGTALTKRASREDLQMAREARQLLDTR
jgi:hypothetical protein